MSGFVQGQTAETAQALLAIAEEQGLDVGVIRTADDGFEVPDEVHDAYVKTLDKKAPAKKAASKETS